MTSLTEVPAANVSSAPQRSPRRWRVPVVVGVVLVLVALVGGGGYLVLRATAVPSFPKLAEAPDSSLHGTVAYGNFDRIRLVALSGAATTEFPCPMGGEGQPYIQDVGWRADGRLQIVGIVVGTDAQWSAVYDPSTGCVDETSSTGVPSTLPSSLTAVAPDGRVVRSTSDRGHITVTVTSAAGTRVLLDAKGGEQYEIGPAGWAPDFQSVLVHDSADRVLLITTGDTPTTRVLAEDAAILWDATAVDHLATT